MTNYESRAKNAAWNECIVVDLGVKDVVRTAVEQKVKKRHKAALVCF